ncbi:D-hexose-6-phosphate mutarotase [Azomonas macrocytogenes]|uniref:Putative glucose-6-phosphate 1-epimerase n=1 Tax=Azomonas macrocytogenes TaxID=69962 RepID=A0A839T697_AZOMA|nr:D-hexose-6-phosphate mutarotase [Azomonas macrocytogenes]MBB3103814.1 glucose-6-phosphate 1-epimerase [Azomonas macrocytogenes]
MSHSLSLRVERQEKDQLTCWRIGTAQAELLVAEQGAQVLSYQRRGEQPLIWLSEQAEFKRGQSLRGGAPLCWPWFGDLKRSPQSVQAMHRDPAAGPFHGLVRNLPWQLQDIAAADHAITLVFGLTHSPEGLPDWPHQVTPSLAIRLDEKRLTLTLASRNDGDQPVALSQALHTYFAVSDIHQVEIPELAGCRYIDTLQDWSERTQDGALTFTGETDRIYLGTPELIRLRDPRWQRQICLQAHDSCSAIVWNPWIDKGKRLSQFADDAWQRMLCIETANVLDDIVELAPGAQANLGVSLWTEPLQA